ncbi:MAG: GNAT family N-acetyltransferase [Dolichospermum sp. DET50]|nr:GNAT family N-acetyltransferase [Dolichospermum sp. DET66]MBS3034111.1 GNAT family N-acetyltransferase [Dolichospermum sp. DET67]MBS3039314.1 GNAT family N-acetyltransferase [Dolichospermum sp. DET50]QSX66540.1 MAG: GNAT family N-acetyltransferase [Dolichospermum sp. DET69]
MALEFCSWTYLDGRIVPTELARLPVDNHALNFGTAAFEAFRLYPTVNGSKILGLDLHLNRLRLSMLSLGLSPVEPEAIIKALWQAVSANNLQQGYVRLLVYPNGNCLGLDPSPFPSAALVMAWRSDSSGFLPPLTLGISHIRRPEAGSTLARGKISGFYAVEAAADRNAKKMGFDGNLMLNPDGTICEMTGANIFIVKDSVLYTPLLPQSIDGVTRRLVIEFANRLNIPVREVPLPLGDLMVADEVFVSGTYHEIRPVSAVDRQILGSQFPGPVTQLLQERFQEMLNNPEDEMASRWLSGTVLEKSTPKAVSQQAYQIRSAELTDIPGVIAGVGSLLAELKGVSEFQLPASSAEICQRLIEGKYPGTIFVANLPGNHDSILGLITLTVQEAIHVGASYILIQELWVHPDHRSQNIGENLIQAVETYCEQKGLARIEVCLPTHEFPGFSNTHHFYKKSGFEDFGPRMLKRI